jgi:hypothetical protein
MGAAKGGGNFHFFLRDYKFELEIQHSSSPQEMSTNSNPKIAQLMLRLTSNADFCRKSAGNSERHALHQLFVPRRVSERVEIGLHFQIEKPAISFHKRLIQQMQRFVLLA